MTNEDDVFIAAEIPYTDSEGNERTLLYTRPHDGCFIVPASHVRELIQYRDERNPLLHKWAYPNFQPNTKWKYFLVGTCTGAAAFILLTYVKNLL
jgi:hypothetical protein